LICGKGDKQVGVLERYIIQASFDTVRHLLEQKQVVMTENNKANLEISIDSLGSNASSDR
jgi:hypothetical protein